MSEAQLRQTKIAYDLVADAYARALPDTVAEAALDLAMIDHFVGLLPGTDVLDAGCGAGRMMTYLTSIDPALTVAGVDLSGAMVDLASTNHRDALVLEGDLAALPFAENRFDGVLAWYSIIHSPFNELREIFAEFHRVLRPGGMTLVAFQSGAGERDLMRAYGQNVDLRAYLHSTEQVAALLEETGLAVQSKLDRGRTETESHSQGFVIATKRPDTFSP